MTTQAPTSAQAPTPAQAPSAAEQSARQFRQILDAQSYPGRALSLMQETGPLDPVGLSPACQILVENLVNRDVQVAFAASLPSAELARWVRLTLNSEVVAVAEADFIVCRQADLAHLDLTQLGLGTMASPELGATLVIDYQGPDLTAVSAEATAGCVRLTGPGINPQGPAKRLNLTEIDAAFWHQRADCNGSFPMGFDIFICRDSELIALPRTTRIQLEGDAACM